MQKKFTVFFMILFLFAGIGLSATAQESKEEVATEQEATDSESEIEVEYGTSVIVETDSGKSNDPDSAWNHQLSVIDLEGYLTFSKSLSDTHSVYWGLFDWLSIELDPDGSQAVLANEITVRAGVSYAPLDNFSLFFDGGVLIATDAMPEDENAAYGGFAFNIGFDVSAEEVPIEFSFAGYLNPMMAFHSASDWYLYNTVDISFLYSFIDDLSDKVGGGFFVDFMLEDEVALDGKAYTEDMVRVDIFTGFDVTIATGNEDIVPGFKAGLCYLHESVREAGVDRDVWRNDLGPLLGVYGECGAFNAFLDFQPILYTPRANPYLRMTLGMGFDL